MSGLIVHCDWLEKPFFTTMPERVKRLAFQNAPQSERARVSLGDGPTIETHFGCGRSLMAFRCVAAIVYEFSHITSLRKNPSG